MINNKGQTLTLFVVILPVLLLLLVLIIDVGKMIVSKLELNNISEIVLDYGLDNLEKENLHDDLMRLVKLNHQTVDVNINIVDSKIYINLSNDSKSLFRNLINIKSSYVGYIVDNEKRIERLGD